jgi:hypothetical protein
MWLVEASIKWSTLSIDDFAFSEAVLSCNEYLFITRVVDKIATKNIVNAASKQYLRLSLLSANFLGFNMMNEKCDISFDTP